MTGTVYIKTKRKSKDGDFYFEPIKQKAYTSVKHRQHLVKEFLSVYRVDKVITFLTVIPNI